VAVDFGCVGGAIEVRAIAPTDAGKRRENARFGRLAVGISARVRGDADMLTVSGAIGTECRK